MTDARGFRAVMTYDGHDRQARWTFPDKALAVTPSTTDYEEYGYDANSNRTSLRKRDGSTLTYSYDALNRMTLKVVPSRADLTAAQTRDVYFDYDLRGLMTKARFDSLSGDGITSGYNGFGELTSSQIVMGTLNKTLTYLYDANSKRTRLTHADAQAFTYARDQLGRVTNVYEGTTQTSTFQLIQAAYDNRGLVDTVQRSTSGNAFLADFTFDVAGRLTGIANDATGTANDLTIGQSFISSGQIATQTRSNDTYSWTGSVNVDRNYTVNGINQYQAAGTASFCHDANGNLTADGTSVYLYDIENRLVAKRAQVGSACPVTDYSGTSQAGLTYDPMGRLFQVTGPTTDTRFLYDGDELVAEYDSAGTIARRYVHSDNADDPVVQYDGASVGASYRRFLLPDERGSIAGLILNDGTAQAKNNYDEYGVPGATNVGRFQYTGQAWIGELGMYHYKARLFDPRLGRFLQVDPVGYEDQVNLYAYVWNDPVNGADPSGLADVAALCEGRATCNVDMQQRVNIVHQEGGKTVVDSTIAVTMHFSKTTDSNGNSSWSTSASVSNVAGKAFSSGELSTMGNSIGAMQQAAIGRGFGESTTQMVTAIGVVETRLGIASAPGAPAFKAGDINPMQLSGGRANLNLEHNIRGAMDVVQWAGRPSNYEPTSTYERYSDGGANTMANWRSTYSTLKELRSNPY